MQDLVTTLKRAVDQLAKGGTLTLASVPDGFDAFVAADLVRALARAAENRAAALVHVARDGGRSRAFQEALAFAAPEIEILDFPAWDCQPYDRGGPHMAIMARRTSVLARLASTRSASHRPRILCVTVNGLTQRVPPASVTAAASFAAAPGNIVDMDGLARWLENNGFLRSGTVRDTGEYAVRGGILDLFAPGMPAPGPSRFLRRYTGIDPHLRCGEPAHDRPAARPRPRADERSADHDGDDPPLPPGLCRPVRCADARRHAL